MRQITKNTEVSGQISKVRKCCHAILNTLMRPQMIDTNDGYVVKKN